MRADTQALMVAAMMVAGGSAAAAWASGAKVGLRPGGHVVAAPLGTASAGGLVIDAVQVSPAPRAAERAQGVVVIVRNSGRTGSAAASLRLTCTPQGTGACPAHLSNAALALRPLAPGATATLAAPSGADVWAPGSLTLTAQIEGQGAGTAKTLVVSVSGPLLARPSGGPSTTPALAPRSMAKAPQVPPGMSLILEPDTPQCAQAQQGAQMPYALQLNHCGFTWRATNLPANARITVTLMRNGAPYRVLGTDLPVDNNPPANDGSPDKMIKSSQSCGLNCTSGAFFWRALAEHIGCSNTLRVSATGTSVVTTTPKVFNIFPPLDTLYPFLGAHAWATTPANGSRVAIDDNVSINWVCLADPGVWPSKTLRLQLYHVSEKVGDIADIPLNFSSCPVSGSYSWKVGTLKTITNTTMIPDGKNLACDSGYFIVAEDPQRTWRPDVYAVQRFTIGLKSARPSHKVPQPGEGPSPPPTF